MDLSSVNNNVNTYAAGTAGSVGNTAAAEKTAQSTAEVMEDKAAVYEKTEEKNTDSANRLYNRDAIVAKLKADQQSRIDSMQSLVEKLLTKQADKTSFLSDLFNLDKSTNLAATFRKAAQAADPETIAQAQADIAEDGYWGVNQTSDRLVSMAIALSGGDTSKADLLKESIQKGFEKATQAWGEELPQLCKDTLEAALQKMDDWKNGVTTAADYSYYLQ